MKFGQRLQRAWRAFKNSPWTPGGPSVYATYSRGNQPYRRGARELLQLYRASPWLFAVENRLANERAVASRWQLFRGHEDDDDRVRISKPDPSTEVLDLLRRPTRVVTGQMISPKQRDKLLALWFGLIGEAFLIKQRGPDRRPVGLVPCSPLWVLSTPTVDAPYYQLRSDESMEPRKIPIDDVIPFVELDAEYPYGRGIGVGMTLADEIETDEGAARMARAELQNMGMPNGLVVLTGGGENAVKQLQAKWGSQFSGPERAGCVDFALGDEVKFISFAKDKLFHDSIDQRKFLRDTFIQVHGISPEIFGVLDKSTRESAYVAYYHLALGALVPWLSIACDTYQAHLLPDFDPSGEVYLAAKSPVPEDRELRLRCIATAPGAFRGRDAREIGEFPPDPELDQKVLSTDPAKATPSQLKQSPASNRMLADPIWAQAMARGEHQ